MSGYENLIVGSEDGVCRITLEPPREAERAVAGAAQRADEALWDADDDRAVHCVIVSRRRARRSAPATT